MTRCCAPVTGGGTRFRAWDGTYARFDHSSSPRCLREGDILLGGKLFCYQHARAWSVHYAIVERIRSFPDKVI